VFTRVIELSPNTSVAFFGRASSYAGERKYREAVKDYGKAISLEPEFWEAYVNRGISLVALGEPGRAVEDYSKAIKLKPGLAEGSFIAGWLTRRPEISGKPFRIIRRPSPWTAHTWKRI